MKNATTKVTCLLQDVLNRCLMNNETAKKNQRKKPSPIISSFLELGRRKTVDAAKICGGAEKCC